MAKTYILYVAKTHDVDPQVEIVRQVIIHVIQLIYPIVSSNRRRGMKFGKEEVLGVWKRKTLLIWKKRKTIN